LLLGAALAPTDPVLASDVQVGPPQSGEDGEVRFALTSEAGMNDGAAFPFVYLAIAIMLAQQTGEPFFLEWLGLDVAWRIGAGLAIGWIGGSVMGFLAFRLPEGSRLSETQEGLAALGITLLCYGSTELLHGYGFLAVFVSALAMRSAERRHEFHTHLHSFSDQVERLLLLILLVCFGASIAEGSIFRNLNWHVVAVAALVLFVVRPISAGLSLIGAPATRVEKAAIAFFGIRGLGSFYYLAFALGLATFPDPEMLWVTVSFVVLTSIVIHGTLVTPVMSRVDRSTVTRSE
jgi:NhaP-type Na+/H+ or K+/H+ antiporter